MPSQSSNEIRSEAVQEILTAMPIWLIRWGNTLILALIVLIFGMSWMIRYPDLITAEVKITTVNPPEKIYATQEGKLEFLFVEDGEEVKSDQTLAVLENSASYKDVFLLKQILDSVELRTDGFYFPLEDIPALLLGDITLAYSNFENRYTEYTLYKKLQPFQNKSKTNQLSAIEAKKRMELLLDQKKLSSKELNFQKKRPQTAKKVIQ